MSTSSLTRRVLGPFNRVEGDLEVSLDIADGVVKAAYVNSPMYRGFEQILQGKAPLDALTLVPRICGICSVAQSAAAAQALANAVGLVPPANGRLAANLTLAVENLADHLTHFYLYFMPDFARPDYAGNAWHPAVLARFRAISGSAANEFLAARASFMQMMGLLAGKWPHTLAVQPGGSTRPLQGTEILRLQRHLREFRRFLETTTFAGPLETFTAIDTLTGLGAWRSLSERGDLRAFLMVADKLDLWHCGHATGHFMSYGAYDEPSGRLFPDGVWLNGLQPLTTAAITEDTAHAWYVPTGMAVHPFAGGTVPQADNSSAYSWCKAPRLDGKVVETGALARQLIAGQPLATDIIGRHGASVAGRVLARFLEIARVVPAMERWLSELTPGEPYCVDILLPGEASGAGLIEAARGSLGHWLTIRRGTLHSYQIIAPTTWNFSPRDATGQPGALEQALVGLAVPATGAIPPLVHHVVRSFDPCMVCTVH